MATSTEDKLVRVSIGGRFRARYRYDDRYSRHKEDGEIENGSDGGCTTDDGACRE